MRVVVVVVGIVEKPSVAREERAPPAFERQGANARRDDGRPEMVWHVGVVCAVMWTKSNDVRCPCNKRQMLFR